MNVRLDFGTTSRGPWRDPWEVDRPVEEILDEAGDGFIYIQRLIIQYAPFFAGLQEILKDIEDTCAALPDKNVYEIVSDAISSRDDLFYEALLRFAKERREYHKASVVYDFEQEAVVEGGRDEV